MVGRRCSSLTRILDKGIPPPTIFPTMSKNWALGAGDDEASKAAICSLCATVNISIGTRADTGRAPHGILHTLVGRPSEGVDQLTFLVVDEDGLVYLL